MIDTERLMLRLMTGEDLDDLLDIFTDGKVMKSFDEPALRSDTIL